jgi:hypothetical protein
MRITVVRNYLKGKIIEIQGCRNQGVYNIERDIRDLHQNLCDPVTKDLE